MDRPGQGNPIKIVNGALGMVPALISEQSDMVIVGVAQTPVDLLLEVKRTDADVVVLELGDDTTPGLFSHLFAEFPRLVVLGIEQRDARAFIEQLCPGDVKSVHSATSRECWTRCEAPCSHPVMNMKIIPGTDQLTAGFLAPGGSRP